MFPKLRILNGENFSGKIADKRAKRKELETQMKAKKIKLDDESDETASNEVIEA